MALVVCCPCGNPLDCDNLDIVITLTCPRCDREIPLEVTNEQGGAIRAVLTVMEGPYWVGERFILPVGEDLRIGSASGNWLSLESDALSEVHCRLHLTEAGRVSIEDQQSVSGTWLGNQRILRGRLEHEHSFRVGEFRFRLDFQSADGVEAAPAVCTPATERAPPLPTLGAVWSGATPALWLIRNRFHLSRGLTITFAWLMGAYHVIALTLKSDRLWPGLKECGVAVAILVALRLAGHRVMLVSRYLKFAPLVVLVLLAIEDVVWMMYPPAVASLLLAACLTLFITQGRSQPMALLTALLGLSATTIMIVLTLQGLVRITAPCW